MRFTRYNKQQHPAALVTAFNKGRVTDAAGRPVTDRAVFDRMQACQMLVTDAPAATRPAPAADSGAQARHEARKHTLANAWKGGSK